MMKTLMFIENTHSSLELNDNGLWIWLSV